MLRVLRESLLMRRLNTTQLVYNGIAIFECVDNKARMLSPIFPRRRPCRDLEISRLIISSIVGVLQKRLSPCSIQSIRLTCLLEEALSS